MKIGEFFRKGKIGKIFHKFEFFSEIWGKSETVGNPSLPQRGWTPLSAITQLYATHLAEKSKR